MDDGLDRLFNPRGIAVVGASRDPRKLGSVILRNLVHGGFGGGIYPVNPEPDQIGDLRAYASVNEIEAPVDLAVIVVPAAAVAGVIDDCARAGVGAAVVITAGFRERGEAGAAVERELLERARAGGVRLVGPNSVGVINTAARLNATFAAAQPSAFPVALVSQSGAVATAILDWARTTGIGFSKFVSLGNMADIDEVDLLRYLTHDSETDAVVLYLEGFSDGRAFLDAARALTRVKPVVAMKVGRSLRGARAALSHTGALGSSDAVVTGAFRQAGIVRADTMEELFDLTLAFSYAPPIPGPRLAVVTNAGGPGVMAVDAVERSGLAMAALSDTTRDALARCLPPAASVANPVDVLGDATPERYAQALELVAADSGVDAVVMMLTPQAITDAARIADSVVELAKVSKKPLFAVFMGGEAVAAGRRILDGARVPLFPYPERAVRAAAALWSYRRYLDAV